MQNGYNLENNNIDNNMEGLIKTLLINNIQIIPCSLKTFINKNGECKKDFRPLVGGYGEKDNYKLRNKDIEKNLFKNCNCLSIRTGDVNNITVIDIDTKDKKYINGVLDKIGIDWDSCKIIVNTKNGYHFYFKYNSILPNKADFLKYVDIRNDGGLIICPSTIYYDVKEKKNQEYKLNDNKNFNIVDFCNVMIDDELPNIDDDFIKYDTNVKEEKTKNKPKPKKEKNIKDYPITPPDSPNKNNFIDKPKYTLKYLNNILFGIYNYYEYEDWWRIGMVYAYESRWSDEALESFKDWSKLDIARYDEKKLEQMWNSWKDKKPNEFTINKLIYYYNLDKNKKENIYFDIYNSTYTKDNDGKYKGTANKAGVIEELNKTLCFIRETSEILVFENKHYFQKCASSFEKLIGKYNFLDLKTNRMVSISNLWLKNNTTRREVRCFGFDPQNKEKEIFNLWRGYNITKEMADEFDIKLAEPIINHIKVILCDNNDEAFEYVMNWMAHVIQKPHIKMGVVLCLKSTFEGAGKNVVITKLEKIIGKEHYLQVKHMDEIIGTFNGIGEAKTLVNLDECVWGKDKKKEGIIKNLVTEENKYINKKNKEAYVIPDYCNYILSTNNECFAPTTEGGRRFYALEVNNKYAGISNKEKQVYFKKIIDAPSEAFAKILYNRPLKKIKNDEEQTEEWVFNPREFIKTKALQQAIEQNWCNVRKWWYNILNDGGFQSNILLKNFSEYRTKFKNIHTDESYVLIKKTYQKNNGSYIFKNNIKQVLNEDYAYSKEFLYNNYIENSPSYKVDKINFWKHFTLYCIPDIKEIRIMDNGIRRYYIVLPDLFEAQKIFNTIQDFNYIWTNDEDDGEWE